MTYQYKTKPYEHQEQVFQLSKDLQYWGFLFEQGTGKTKVALDTASYLYQTGKITAVLVFSNKGSIPVWGKEPAVHCPVEYASHVWRGLTTKKERQEILNLYAQTDKLKILAMNIESMVSEKARRVAFKYAQNHKTILIVDESSTVKNPKAKRTKHLIKLAQTCPYRRILTGTPITNNPLDIWAQSEVLNKGALGYSNFYAFRMNYAIIKELNKGGPRPIQFVVGYRHLDHLKARIEKIASVVKKEDCLDLPEKVYQEYEVELTPEQKNAYAMMKNEAIMLLEKKEKTQIITAQNVLTRLMRLQQIVAGWVGEDATPLKSNRMKALTQILDECSGKVIIWATFRAALSTIYKELCKQYGEDKVGRYYGEVSQQEREATIDGFQQGGIRFLVANQQTAGYGLTLTASNTNVYFSQSYKLEERLQSEDRTHRIGQSNKCTYITMVSRGTTDEKIAEALVKKRAMADTLICSNWRELF